MCDRVRSRDEGMRSVRIRQDIPRSSLPVGPGSQHSLEDGMSVYLISKAVRRLRAMVETSLPETGNDAQRDIVGVALTRSHGADD